MSIAEKLTAIAENQQKVYDAGCSKGRAEGVQPPVYDGSVNIADVVNLITFTIDGVTYQAEEGMAWSEWIGSEYNTNNLNFYYFPYAGPGSYICLDNEYPYGTDVIINGASYVIVSSGSSN